MSNLASNSDPVTTYFQSCLKAKQRPDGNLILGIAKGDCTIMLQLIRMKLDDFSAAIDLSNPGRFRGTSSLVSDFNRVLGDVSKLHYTKWGASHVRGAFRDDNKRGNKRHPIRLIELLNTYSGSLGNLQQVYDQCIRLQHQYWDSFSLNVIIQEEDPFQKRLLALLTLPSLGRVQQGLVYSAIRRRYGESKRITTKKTFAGDEQSSTSGQVQRGDVQVWSGEELAIALEVKDAIVDAVAWQRVEATHGQHEYALFVLAKSYNPLDLQWRISGLDQTYAVHLADFILSVVFTTAADEGKLPSTVLEEILAIYNDEFCGQVEQDRSSMIEIAPDKPQTAPEEDATGSQI